MTSAAAPPPAFRISLRELLALFTAVTIGFIALRYANRYWPLPSRAHATGSHQ